MKQIRLSRLLVIVLTVLLVGCANTAKRMGSLTVGMSKFEVYQLLGQPESELTVGPYEYLEYSLSEAPPATMQTVCAVGGLYTIAITAVFRVDECRSKVDKYFVRLKGARVDRYGQGDVSREIASLPSGGSSAEKPESPEEASSSGTGFFITKSGYLLTSQHVVDKADRIIVVLESGQNLEASLFREDEANDIAVLKVVADTDFPFVSFAYTEGLMRGDEVMTLGYPLVDLQGQNQKATFGRVNAKSGIQDDFRYLQVDIPIQPGNSGGPLINKRGEVVGIIAATLKFTATLRETGSLPQSVNYAVKADYALPIISDLEISKSSQPRQTNEFSEIVSAIENSVVRVIAIKD